MNVAGIIAEYNPFHKGHEYHIEETKKKTKCDYIIVVMSGNYTQRGLPAIFDKYERAGFALHHGADLVLELPSLFSTASAEGFARGAVSILHKLGVCSILSFGSETCDLELLLKLAVFLNHEPQEYKIRLQEYLQDGNSFPKARENALSHFFPAEKIADIFGANDILGIEYLRAIDHFSSSIVPLCVKRKDNRYEDTSLNKKGFLSSATSIRQYMEEAMTAPFFFREYDENSLLHSSLPSSYFPLEEQQKIYYPVSPKDFSLLLHSKLLFEEYETLSSYLDLSPALADRIRNQVTMYRDPLSFAAALKTKELTHTRICRSLFHLLLNITKEEYDRFASNIYCPYAKVLGFKKESSALLHEIKKNSSIPLLTKNAAALEQLDELSGKLYINELRRTHLYEAVLSNKYQLPFCHEYKKTPLIM